MATDEVIPLGLRLRLPKTVRHTPACRPAGRDGGSSTRQNNGGQALGKNGQK